MSALGSALREARDRAGLSQRQVADAIGVPHVYPSRWERGANQPSLRSLVDLADRLDLDLDVLVRAAVDDQRGSA